MKKEKGSSLKQGIVLLCAASILLVGCGEKETGSEQPGIAPMEQTGGERKHPSFGKIRGRTGTARTEF